MSLRDLDRRFNALMDAAEDALLDADERAAALLTQEALRVVLDILDRTPDSESTRSTRLALTHLLERGEAILAELPDDGGDA